MSAAWTAEQSDEVLAVKSIYGPEVVQVCDERGSITAHIPSRDACPRLGLRAELPADYPALSPPVFTLHPDPPIPGDAVAHLAAQLTQAFVPGEVVLFAWIEQLQEWAGARRSAAAADSAGACEPPLTEGVSREAPSSRDGLDPPSRPQQVAGRHERSAEAAAAAAAAAATIVHGAPITEKRSTFQAHLAPVRSVQQVNAVLECLLANTKIRGASHPCIMAYRIERPDAPGTFAADCDDDGEAAAGGRLLRLLQLTDARDVVVVVSRWFGGVHLGPARFALITNVARQLLDQCGYIPDRPGGERKGKAGK